MTTKVIGEYLTGPGARRSLTSIHNDRKTGHERDLGVFDGIAANTIRSERSRSVRPPHRSR